MNRNDIIGDIWKAKLLLSDYTLTDIVEDKETFLTLVNRYIDRIGDPKLSLVFEKVCISTGKEEDLYTEILTDLLTELETNLHITTDTKEA